MNFGFNTNDSSESFSGKYRFFDFKEGFGKTYGLLTIPQTCIRVGHVFATYNNLVRSWVTDVYDSDEESIHQKIGIKPAIKYAVALKLEGEDAVTGLLLNKNDMDTLNTIVQSAGSAINMTDEPYRSLIVTVNKHQKGIQILPSFTSNNAFEWDNSLFNPQPSEDNEDLHSFLNGISLVDDGSKEFIERLLKMYDCDDVHDFTENAFNKFAKK